MDIQIPAEQIPGQSISIDTAALAKELIPLLPAPPVVDVPAIAAAAAALIPAPVPVDTAALAAAAAALIPAPVPLDVPALAKQVAGLLPPVVIPPVDTAAIAKAAAALIPAQTLALTNAVLKAIMQPPQLAAEVGYNQMTFGFKPVLEQNWKRFNMLWLWNAITPGQATQNADGSILLTKDPSNYGADICTAWKLGKDANNHDDWAGKVFGGGFFVEFTVSFPTTLGPLKQPWPGVWSDCIKALMVGHSAVPGQPDPNFVQWIEVDFMEWIKQDPTKAGNSLHHWYGSKTALPYKRSTLPASGGYTLPPGADFSKPTKIACRWVMATATTPGRLDHYINRVLVKSVSWNKTPAVQTFPPPVGEVGCVIDQTQFAFILGSSPENPITVYSCEVWQADETGNTSR